MPTAAENRQTYLAWLRTTMPNLYVASMQHVANPKKTNYDFGKARGIGAVSFNQLAGLGDDGTDTTDQDLAISEDPLSYAPPDVSAPPASDTTVIAPPSSSSSSSSSSSGGSAFDSVVKAVSSVASTVVATEAQQNLLNVNTQRAKQGLPPLNANGQIITSNMLAPTTSAISQAEAALAGNTGSLLLLLGGAALLFMVARR